MWTLQYNVQELYEDDLNRARVSTIILKISIALDPVLHTQRNTTVDISIGSELKQLQL